jgi:hypothetical protein
LRGVYVGEVERAELGDLWPTMAVEDGEESIVLMDDRILCDIIWVSNRLLSSISGRHEALRSSL